MISLIVPIYNVKEYIIEFLDSVKAQTFADFEAILVDDGSNDGTEHILDAYAVDIVNFKVIHQRNGGVVKAWKKGIENSSGEYIAFADPDDVLMPDMLETLSISAWRNNADIVIAGMKRLEKGKEIPMAADAWNLEEGVYESEKLEFIKKNLLGNEKNRNNIFFFAKWNKLFKRDIIIKNLEYSNDNISFGDDVCINLSAIYDCEKLVYTHKQLYIYRIREKSITTKSFKMGEIDNALLLINCVRYVVNQKGYMNDFIYYNDPSYHIVRLMKKIKGLSLSRKEKKSLLGKLKSHELVLRYKLGKAKKYISNRRFWAIWLLKHNCFGILLKLL